jgi:hypothetical protein
MDPQSILNTNIAPSPRRGIETNVFVKVKYQCAANGGLFVPIPSEYPLGTPQLGVRHSLGIERLGVFRVRTVLRTGARGGSDSVWFWSEPKAARPKNGRPLQLPRTMMVL